MAPSLKALVTRLRFNDHNLQKVRQNILSAIENPEALERIIGLQCDNRGRVNCFSCESEGACFALTGVINLLLGKNEEAIKEFEIANYHFRSRDETWNSILGLELLGIAFEKGGNRHEAILQYTQAMSILEHKYLPLHASEYKRDGAKLKEELHSLIETPIKSKKKKIKSRMAVINNYLMPVMMPIYNEIQAHPGGPVWVEPDPDNGQSYISKIILEDKECTILSTTDSDIVTLTSDKKYGWAKVSGVSMNAARPVPISDKNFVLFYQAQDANENSIVVASCPDMNRTGYEYVIKRYNKRDKLLLSETNPPNLYDPIPMKKGFEIIGVVIAVAKPV